jgi:polar amino acid transport system permease protein
VVSSRQAKHVSLAVSLVLLAVVLGSVKWHFVATLSPGEVLKWWRPLAVAGLVTLSITACAVMLGLGLGILIAVAMWMPIGRVLKTLLHLYIEFGRNVPLIVQLFWIHFSLPLLTGVSTSAFVSGFVALAFQSSAYLADITRGGIQSIHPGQWDAAHALGMPGRWIWAEVILPQAMRTMLPAIGNLATSFLNASALLSLLGVSELTSVSTKISDYAMRPIEIMTATAVLYLGCNLLVAALFHALERRFSRAPNAL